MYHSVADTSTDPYSVSVQAFRDQISWLLDEGFTIVPLSFLVESLQALDQRALRKKVVLTFDDGYRDFVTDAFPILNDYRITATVFIVTEMLGGKASWSNALSHVPLMSEAEIHEIKSHGISLGSHTANHVNLSIVNREDLHQELTKSYNKLECLGEKFKFLSYPWGQWSPSVADVVKAVGFECALAVGEGKALSVQNLYWLPRMTMRRQFTVKDLRCMMNPSLTRNLYRKCREIPIFSGSSV